MNKSLIKLLTDFGPLLIFFIVYYRGGKDLETAIPPLIVATIIAVIIIFYLEKKISQEKYEKIFLSKMIELTHYFQNY